MKKGFIIIASLVLLVSVGFIGKQSLGSITPTGETVYKYTATFTQDTPSAYKTDLVLAIQRSVKAKFTALGAPSSRLEVMPGDEAVSVIRSWMTQD